MLHLISTDTNIHLGYMCTQTCKVKMVKTLTCVLIKSILNQSISFVVLEEVLHLKSYLSKSTELLPEVLPVNRVRK